MSGADALHPSEALRFLIVDDDQDIRDVLEQTVMRLGHDARTAHDGAAAVEELAVQRFDFMLLDLTMPRMTGQDVLRWLRDRPQVSADLRVVVISARIDGDVQSELEALGAHAVLAKPLRRADLLGLVEAARR